MKKTKVYLDNSASTPVDPKVLKAMMPYFTKQFGNASSLHYFGLDGRVAVDKAQAKVADFFGCEKLEVYFTSGATESDNMAIFGPIRAIQKSKPNGKYHIITTAIEHDAILEPCQRLEKMGVEVTYLPVNKSGLVRVADLEKAIKPNTVLVSVMYVNNEIGTIQPIRQIGRLLSKLNNNRKNRIYFHTDATQALSCCDCDVKKLGVDLLSLSAHKIYGPKGVGAIYIKEGTPLESCMLGGHQQTGVRPGTYNVPGIVGLGEAVKLLSGAAQIAENKRLSKIRDYLIEKVLKAVPDVRVNGSLSKRVETNANFIFKGVEGESLLLVLSQKGIGVSTGSACSSGSLEPSHVLLAIGLKPELAHGSMRVSLGRFNTKEDIDYLLKYLPMAVERLRSMSPFR